VAFGWRLLRGDSDGGGLGLLQASLMLNGSGRVVCGTGWQLDGGGELFQILYTKLERELGLSATASRDVLCRFKGPWGLIGIFQLIREVGDKGPHIIIIRMGVKSRVVRWNRMG